MVACGPKEARGDGAQTINICNNALQTTLIILTQHTRRPEVSRRKWRYMLYAMLLHASCYVATCFMLCCYMLHAMTASPRSSEGYGTNMYEFEPHCW